MNKTQEFEYLKVEAVNLAGMGFSMFSFSPIAGQIYALLYMSFKPLTLNNMVKELEISKSSASTNIRALESWGAVKKIWVKGDRKDYYEANPDVMSIVLKRFKEGMKKRMLEFSKGMKKIEDKLFELKSNPATKEIEFYESRFKRVKKIFSDFEHFVKIMPEELSDRKMRIIGKIIS
ncbi:MAG: hypothetical protein L6420_10830 [Elusimicrobia bacterium]|nr:hypothetical protein [Elusimicrobiota bacterium]